MKVLLTGASGFVGSHILDSLRARGMAVAVLLRPSSDRRYIQPHLPALEIRSGSINDPQSLRLALDGITHVIHCAGCTKAVRRSGYYAVNHIGTKNVVDEVHALGNRIERLVHLSSLAAAGPGTPSKPVRECDTPAPVSEYGKSKLAGENEIRRLDPARFCIIRPPAVYGPRDTGFFTMFKAVDQHLLPRSAKDQMLSLVYVKDLADACVTCLTHPAAAGKTYFAAARELASGRQMAEEIALRMNCWTVPFPLPAAVLWSACLLQDAFARLTNRPAMLNLQKYAELRAPGWVCDGSLLTRETGCECPTDLKTGVALTLDWYRQNGWLK